MSFSIDKSLSWDGLYKITTDSGSLYMVKIKESSLGSGLWTIDLIRPEGKPPPLEIFKSMSLISEVCKEYMNSVGGNKVLLLITGDSEESLQKAKIFSRWMKDDWECSIDRAEIKFNGVRNPNIKSTNYAVSAFRKIKQQIDNTQITQSLINTDIKFCFNCGTPNNNFSFCPSCGTKLKQA